MARISSGIRLDSNFLNLKAMDKSEIRKEIPELLVEKELILSAFKTVRDQVIFTNKRIFVVNVQGITGKKISYFSYPYSKVQYYGIETAGLVDIDSELFLRFMDGTILQFDFKTSVNIKEIHQLLSDSIL
ncbi:MAG: PH domain-containing protein [Bacilli bacterium]|nr:PH domain-containing protein [Bacilli bacterium]